MSGAASSRAMRSAPLARLHVESSGTGPPLVLLHGFGLHGGVFDEMVTPLSRVHRVHVVDLPGHGRSSDVQATSLDAVTDLVADTVADVIAGERAMSSRAV